MKIRQGFVSNSSSSSFVINLADITAKQKQQIENHAEIVAKMKKNEDSIFDVTYEQLSKMTIEEVQDLLFKFYAYSLRVTEDEVYKKLKEREDNNVYKTQNI